jgi:nucleoid-associated protein YgaU
MSATLLLFSGCSTTPPRWRAEAVAALEELNKEGAAGILGAEYRGTEGSIAAGDRFLSSGENETAEKYYFMALQEAELMGKKLPEEKVRLEAEKKKHQEKAEKTELEKRIRGMREERDKRIAAEKNDRERRLNVEKLRHAKEHALSVSHTVKRGETLPSIAALPEVYNDPGLWPLLYRSNRDQIRDPKHISPGQVLRIPRNVSREEISEALRFSRWKQLP